MMISSKLAACAALTLAVCLSLDSRPASAQTVPSPWSAGDIGNPQLRGSSSFSNDSFNLEAAGYDIWGSDDHFHFVYRPIVGDVDIVARIDWFSAPDSWAKAGVMIRASLEANAANAFAMLTAENGTGYQRRANAGAGTAYSPGPWYGAPHWLRLTREGTRVTAFSSTDGANWEVIDSDTVALGETAYVGLALTSHQDWSPANATIASVRVSSAGTAAPSVPTWPAAPTPALPAAIPPAIPAAIPPAAQVAPAGVSSADIGAPAVAGTTSFSDGAYTIRAGGSDIWNGSDQFRYVYQQVSGDVDVVARVTSLADTDAWAKAGLMIRESLAPTARNAMALTTPGSQAFQWRADSSGASQYTNGGALAAPVWLRLVRAGSYIQASRSSDGYNWVLMSSERLDMSATVYVGLAVTSHNPGTATVAVIDNVRVSTAGGSVWGATQTLPEPNPAGSGAAAAQDLNAAPRAIVFVASPDHETLVSRYVLEIYAGDGTQSAPIALSDMGKPSLGPNREITVDRATLLQALPAGSYVASVTAIGDGGSSRSLTAAFTR